MNSDCIMNRLQRSTMRIEGLDPKHTKITWGGMTRFFGLERPKLLVLDDIQGGEEEVWTQKTVQDWDWEKRLRRWTLFSANGFTNEGKEEGTYFREN